MPKPSLRTRSRRRQIIKVPGGNAKIHYKQEKAGYPHCARCGRRLSGVPRLTPSEIRKLPLSRRRPERMYSGVLCHGCLRELLKQAVRNS